MIIIGSVNKKIIDDIKVNPFFSKYIQNIKEKKEIILLEEIAELLINATNESMKTIKNQEYNSSINVLDLEKSKEKLRPIIKCHFEEIKAFIIGINPNASIAEKLHFETAVKERKVDFLKLSGEIKNKINKNFNLSYSNLSLKNNENLFSIELTQQEVLEIFFHCIKQIEIEYIYKHIFDKIFSKVTLEKKDQNKEAEKVGFVVGNQKERLLSKILAEKSKNILKLLEKEIRIVGILINIGEKAIIEIKQKDQTAETQSANQTLETFSELIMNIEEEFNIFTKTFFQFHSEYLEKKNNEIKYEISSNINLFTVLKVILKSVADNIDNIDIIYSGIKEVLKIHNNSSIENKLEKADLLEKMLVEETNHDKTIKKITELGIEIKLLNDANNKKIKNSEKRTFHEDTTFIYE